MFQEPFAKLDQATLRHFKSACMPKSDFWILENWNQWKVPICLLISLPYIHNYSICKIKQEILRKPYF